MLYMFFFFKFFFFANFCFFFDNSFFDNIFIHIHLFSIKLYTWLFLFLLIHCLLSISQRITSFNVIHAISAFYLICIFLLTIKLVQVKFFSLCNDTSFFFLVQGSGLFSFQSFPLFSSVHSILIVSVVYAVTLLFLAILNSFIFFFLKKSYEDTYFKNFVVFLYVILMFGSLWTFYNSYQYLFWNWDSIEIITLAFFFCFILSAHSFYYYSYLINFFFVSIFLTQLFRNFFFMSSHHIKLEIVEKHVFSILWYNNTSAVNFDSTLTVYYLYTLVTIFFIASSLLNIKHSFFLSKNNSIVSLNLFKMSIACIIALMTYFSSNVFSLLLKIAFCYSVLLANLLNIMLIYTYSVSIYYCNALASFLLFMNVGALLFFHFDLYLLFFILFFFLKLTSVYGLFNYSLFNESSRVYSLILLDFNCNVNNFVLFFNFKLMSFYTHKINFYLRINNYSILKQASSQFLYYLSFLNTFGVYFFFFYVHLFFFFYAFIIIFVFISVHFVKLDRTVLIKLVF